MADDSLSATLARIDTTVDLMSKDFHRFRKEDLDSHAEIFRQVKLISRDLGQVSNEIRSLDRDLVDHKSVDSDRFGVVWKAMLLIVSIAIAIGIFERVQG